MLGESMPLWAKLLAQFVNFGILVGILVKFAGKPLKDYLRKRRDTVKEQIDEAKKLLKEAEQAKALYEEKLSGLEAEVEAFRKSAIEALESEKAKILREAEGLAVRIREQARLAYEQELKDAMGMVRAEIAGRAIASAEARIRETLTQKDHDRMVEEFIQSVRSDN
jgi:F-type H+-transporting ATPase subunit b